MEPIDLWRWLILLVIVLVVLGMHNRGWYWAQLQDELKSVFPVYSAETTQGKEAEFIKDSLPGRFPIWIVLIAVVLFGAVAWWLTR